MHLHCGLKKKKKLPPQISHAHFSHCHHLLSIRENTDRHSLQNTRRLHITAQFTHWNHDSLAMYTCQRKILHVRRKRCEVPQSAKWDVERGSRSCLLKSSQPWASRVHSSLCTKWKTQYPNTAMGTLCCRRCHPIKWDIKPRPWLIQFIKDVSAPSTSVVSPGVNYVALTEFPQEQLSFWPAHTSDWLHNPLNSLELPPQFDSQGHRCKR